MNNFIEKLGDYAKYAEDPDLEEKIIKEKGVFEQDFFSLHAEVQQLRSENELLVDQLNNKSLQMQAVSEEMSDRATLIQMLESKMKEMKL